MSSSVLRSFIFVVVLSRWAVNWSTETWRMIQVSSKNDYYVHARTLQGLEEGATEEICLRTFTETVIDGDDVTFSSVFHSWEAATGKALSLIDETLEYRMRLIIACDCRDVCAWVSVDSDRRRHDQADVWSTSSDVRRRVSSWLDAVWHGRQQSAAEFDRHLSAERSPPPSASTVSFDCRTHHLT